MSEPYLVTVYIAERGTPYQNPRDGSISKSGGGHMWYVTRHGNDEKSYGFAPRSEGSAFGAGRVM